MNKFIIWSTILSVMNLIGCYYQEQMSPDDYSFDENSIVKITTKDTVYNFNGNDYYLENDTLFGKVSKKLDERRTLKFIVEIPVEDIERVEVERSDAVGTTFTVLGVLAGIFGVLVIIFAVSYGS